MVNVGQKIQVKTTFKNTGTVRHKFPVGLTFRHVATNTDIDIPFEYQTENAGNSGTVTFNWNVTSAAPKGPYTVITAVWESVQNNLGVNRLDDEIIPNAFSID